jgi:hypothetical protein
LSRINRRTHVSKVEAASLILAINHLVAEIGKKHLKLKKAGKKELAYIHKHLRKAHKAIERNLAAGAKKQKTAKKGKKSSKKAHPATTKAQANLKSTNAAAP